MSSFLCTLCQSDITTQIGKEEYLRGDAYIVRGLGWVCPYCLEGLRLHKEIVRDKENNWVLWTEKFPGLGKVSKALGMSEEEERGFFEDLEKEES